MDKNTVTLLTVAVFGGIGIFFTILGLATPGWGGRPLFNCGGNCGERTTAGVFLIIAILVLAIAIVFVLLVARHCINTPSETLKSVVLVLLTIAAVIIIIGYSRLIPSWWYSYHVTVTASIFTFFSAIIYAHWLGSTSAAFNTYGQ